MKQLQEVVEELGSLTVEQISQKLIKEGVRGHKWKCHDCPIALYIESKTGNPTVVNPEYIYDKQSDKEVHAPQSVQEFIVKFDDDVLPAELYIFPLLRSRDLNVRKTYQKCR